MDNKNGLTKKFGLFTAICMVAGIVMGSGVFFKAKEILIRTEGNMYLGILAWIIGGAIMLACILSFSFMATKYENVNGIVDYAESTTGKAYAYGVGWFLTVIYYPTLTAVLSWLSASYTLRFIVSCYPDLRLTIPASEGGCEKGPECIIIMLFYLCLSYAVNTLAPKIAGKVQTSTTVIKLIPLGLMSVVGIAAGLFSPTKMLVNNFVNVPIHSGTPMSNLLLSAVCSAAFAYEGWIIATSINAELKDSKKNLPKALVIGGIIVVSVYILYFLGLAGGADSELLMTQGSTVAFTNVFGGVFGNLLNLFVAISCMGTMNGLMLASVRGMYSVSARGEGPKPRIFGEIDNQTNMPNNSAILGLAFSAFWGLYFVLSNITGMWDGAVVFAGTPFESVLFKFDASEIPIITLYGMYIPIFINWMRKAKDMNSVKRFIMPALSIVASVFMIYASIVAHGMQNLWYIVFFAVVMAIGFAFYNKKKGV